MPQNISITTKNDHLPQVDTCSVLSYGHRCFNVTVMGYKMCMRNSKKNMLETKLPRFYKVIALQTLLCGSQCWTS